MNDVSYCNMILKQFNLAKIYAKIEFNDTCIMKRKKHYENFLRF